MPRQDCGSPRGERLPARPRRGRGPRPTPGGPPKAKLGGPGGKTFDEMVAAGEVTSKAFATPTKGKKGSHDKSNKGSLAGVELMPSTGDDKPKYNAWKEPEDGTQTNAVKAAATKEAEAVSSPPDNNIVRRNLKKFEKMADPPRYPRPDSLHLSFKPSGLSTTPMRIPLPLSPIPLSNGTHASHAHSQSIKDAVLRRTPMHSTYRPLADESMPSMAAVSPSSKPGTDGGSIEEIDVDVATASDPSPKDETDDLAETSLLVPAAESTTATPKPEAVQAAEPASLQAEQRLEDKRATPEAKRGSFAYDQSSIDGSVENWEEAVSIATKLRPSAAVFIPMGSGTTSRASSVSGSKRHNSQSSLSLTAAPFVPGKRGLESGQSTPHSKGSLSQIVRSNHSSSRTNAPSATPQLKPTAPEFVPTSRKLASATPPGPEAKDGTSSRSIPQQLHPTAPPFVPSYGYSPSSLINEGGYMYESSASPVSTPQRRLRPAASSFVPGTPNLNQNFYQEDTTPSSIDGGGQPYDTSEARDESFDTQSDSIEITGLFAGRPLGRGASAGETPATVRPPASPMGVPMGTIRAAKFEAAGPVSDDSSSQEELTVSDDYRSRALTIRATTAALISFTAIPQPSVRRRTRTDQTKPTHWPCPPRANRLSVQCRLRPQFSLRPLWVVCLSTLFLRDRTGLSAVLGLRVQEIWSGPRTLSSISHSGTPSSARRRGRGRTAQKLPTFLSRSRLQTVIARLLRLQTKTCKSDRNSRPA